ncbi:retrotransposon protein, putative, ty1-copia subclass [Tanacetum coccineum]|uniref:Retrotransposon protein, putative, ty1-copia subclass n=1 Tax=Tanacetum coccineum TaxID=301880 RepID=A0ABQ5IJZ1_9ASTR
MISPGTLEKEGYTVKLQSGKVKVINSFLVVLSGIRRDNCVYSLDGHEVVLEKERLFGKKSVGKLSFCENCVMGKLHRVSFGVGRHTTHGVIDYVHSDLWGASQVESLGEWKQLVENQTRRKVKKLRTDNGLEFYNREFEQLCVESKIARHLKVTGMPQQNGLAEPAYLINRSPSTAIEKKTPMEMWSGHPSDYGMLRIFGCVVYPHDKQGKLEPRAVKCVLLGYPEGLKGYILYRIDNESPKIVTSRNVVFNESVMYKDTLKDSGADQEDGDDEDAGDQETNQTSNLTDYQLARDRELRTRTKPLRFRNESNMAAYAFVVPEEEDTHEPLTYQEAVACEDSSKWKDAMKEEMDSLRKNKTWELVDHPAGKKLMSYKWLFKIKEGIEGVQNPRYKARLVARGFTQRADYELEQLDVKTTFLRGNIEEVIYMRQPSGDEQGTKVCLLKKSLYGLKQSPRQGYKRFDEYMLSNGFKRSSYDNCVYYRSYAPDWSNKSLLKKEFDMKELGEAKKILGMEIVKDRSCKIIRVSQSGYVSNILNNFRINNGKSVQMPLGGHFKLSLKDYLVRNCDVERMSKVLYANATRSLMFLMVCTRQDIVYAVSVVSRYLANPGKNHWEAVKWILKYLRDTANVGLVYWTNQDYAKDPDKETEYMTLTEAVKQAIWLRTKHINVRYHFIREVLEAKTVKVLKLGTEHNVADALTKVVSGLKLQHCLELLNVGVG